MKMKDIPFVVAIVLSLLLGIFLAKKIEGPLLAQRGEDQKRFAEMQLAFEKTFGVPSSHFDVRKTDKIGEAVVNSRVKSVLLNEAATISALQKEFEERIENVSPYEPVLIQKEKLIALENQINNKTKEFGGHISLARKYTSGENCYGEISTHFNKEGVCSSCKYKNWQDYINQIKSIEIY